ncbi:MAG: putative membrane protein [Cenarchaeum symbiont of Oopsacas minuta]|nr:putative membrane protein [Cenarchaeum symbiont of Oopsacas minuta]
MYVWTIVLITCIALLTIHGAYGQVLPEPVVNENIHAVINSDGIVYVTHEIINERVDSQVVLLNGTTSKISVSDSKGDAIEYTLSDKGRSVVIKAHEDSKHTIIEYELADAVIKKNGAWVWDVLHQGSIKFSYPNGTKIVFINETPVYIENETSKIRCHGCIMYMTYVIDEPEYLLKVEWEDRIFESKIQTLGSIGSIDFIQSEKSISFDYSGEHFVTVEIPREFLWDPYQVWLDDVKIINYEIEKDKDTVLLSFKPESGTITIIGASVIPEIPAGALVLVTAIGITVAITINRFPSRL